MAGRVMGKRYFRARLGSKHCSNPMLAKKFFNEPFIAKFGCLPRVPWGNCFLIASMAVQKIYLNVQSLCSQLQETREIQLKFKQKILH